MQARKKGGPAGLVVAGTHSGSGKTTVALGLMAAFKNRRLSVAPFKVGPDFIDPGHHRTVTGNQSRNLDGWMLSKSVNNEIFFRNVSTAQIAVIEGVMGMFDGYDGLSEAGSTVQMAKWLGLPILLVVDARSMARSAGALVYGFTRFDPDCRFCGVVFNRVGSSRHLQYLRQSLDGFSSPPLLGGIPRNDNIAIPERHLGLFTSEDHCFSKSQELALADFMEENLDLDKLLENLPLISSDVCVLENSLSGGANNSEKAIRPINQEEPWTEKHARIGVARDQAFCFYYPENIEALKENGAEIIYFSPIKDRMLPEDLDGVYLGGGYPELHAKKLSENESMRKAFRENCAGGMPIYAECGGFMFLCEKLIAKDGSASNMAGCFPFTTRMNDRLSSLGYREIKLIDDAPVGKKGLLARGHEFHYSQLEQVEIEPAVAGTKSRGVREIYAAADRSGKERTCPGYLVNRCLGSYVHLHFKSSPTIGKNFVSACETYRRER